MARLGCRVAGLDPGLFRFHDFPADHAADLQEFQVLLTDVALVLTVTVWMRLVSAVCSGRLGDRVGRQTPLMISILWYSLCNFIAGFSPTF